MNSPNWIKNKKEIINPINKNYNKCFQYAVTVAINHKEILKDPKNKPFLGKYYWQEINYQSEKDDWKKIQKNNLTVVLNILCIKKEKIYPTYVSKQKSKCEE